MRGLGLSAMLDFRLVLVVALATVLLTVLFLTMRRDELTSAVRELRARWRFRPPLILALFGALLVAACATAPANEGRGLSAAQDAVAAACAGVHQAYLSGVITKANVTTAAGLCDQADDASIAARKAYAAGDSTTYAGAIAQLNTLAAEIVALEGAKQ